MVCPSPCRFCCCCCHRLSSGNSNCRRCSHFMSQRIRICFWCPLTHTPFSLQLQLNMQHAGSREFLSYDSCCYCCCCCCFCCCCCNYCCCCSLKNMLLSLFLLLLLSHSHVRYVFCSVTLRTCCKAYESHKYGYEYEYSLLAFVFVFTIRNSYSHSHSVSRSGAPNKCQL